MRPRYPHKLTDSKATKAPKYVIFFDTETKEKVIDDTTRDLSLKLGHAIATRRDPSGSFVAYSECSFTKRPVFARWLENVCTGRERYYLVAHNIGFDLRVTAITRHLIRSGWSRSWTVIEGNNFMMRFRKGPTTIMLMNNLQLFPVSLASLGESIGIPKLHVDFDKVSDTDLLTYCKRDVEVMRAAWDRWYAFISASDLGNFRTTVGSQALGAFRHRFKTCDIFIHTNVPAIELERRSYHGGRVECFRLGVQRDGPYYCLDVNSMYPYIMRDYKVPTKLLGSYATVSLEDFATVRRTMGYIVEATIRTEVPCLPSIHDGRMIFPVGEISGVFCKPELELALEHGTLVSVKGINVYKEEIAFDKYVDFFYAARKKFKAEGNESFDYFSKLLLNSLYGKFGQRITEYAIVATGHTAADHSGKTYDLGQGREVKFRVIDGIVEFEMGEHESSDSFVAIASYITSAARSYLSRLIIKAGASNVLYCDTDSLFVNQEGFSRLTDELDPGTLGKLKLEATAQEITLLGAKRYHFGEKSRSKGIRKNAVLVGENTYRQEHFETFTGSLMRGTSDVVRIHTVTKKLSSSYLKGNVQKDGSITPFVLPVQT